MIRQMQEPTPEQRTDPPSVADERPMLEAWLDFHRATLLWKCDGLSPEQLTIRSAEPSTLSLLGLVRHMSEVERGWFRRTLASEAIDHIYVRDDAPDAEFDELDPAKAADDFAIFRAEVEQCRAVAARSALDDLGRQRHGRQVSLRWIFLHMIEEYARHNGHADLLRERIDGVIGD